LIAKKDIPPLVGIFIKPGVVPAANENALPRFNRSYEYDSITPTYSQFLIDELLPAIEAKHRLKLSTDPNHAAISGNSSGGICAFMVAWHRPDRFRRVFTGVGTYVGIHGADQLPVLVRKFEPKPLRVFLQSGTGDNNLYCGDWWMANQMMERSLTWAGYDVNHAWGEGGHNQKHASQIFPDVLRWLWRDWQTDIEVKANPKGESKWKGYEVVGELGWLPVVTDKKSDCETISSNEVGIVACAGQTGKVTFVHPDGRSTPFTDVRMPVGALAFVKGDGLLIHFAASRHFGDSALIFCGPDKQQHKLDGRTHFSRSLLADFEGNVWIGAGFGPNPPPAENVTRIQHTLSVVEKNWPEIMCLSPDQSLIYGNSGDGILVATRGKEGELRHFEEAYRLESDVFQTPRPWEWYDGEMCVDTNGWLYVATSLGVQILDQAGRVNFIIPTPEPALDVCFGGKDLSELFIACGESIYKRPTKAKGVVSGQQAPIKPPAPKL